jgi:plastocyanin
MNRALAILTGCSALALAAGCGSSKSSSTTSSTSSTSTPKSGVVVNGKINYASPPANAPVKSGLVNIAYHEISIEPDTLKVKVGSTIKWTNQDPVEHNVTSASGPTKFASKNFGEGGTFEIKVDKPGVIHYRCTLHPATMNGTIEVVK